MKKKKTTILPFLCLVFSPLLLMIIGLFLCYHAGGFSLDKICSDLPFNENWEVEPLTKKQRSYLMEEIFPQPYYFLSSGKYCYVFISADKRYILRFFKKKHFSSQGWLTHYPLTLLQYFGYTRPSDSLFLSEHIFASYKSAYESLRTETGLLYLHLNKTREFKTKVLLIDVKGRKHRVSLDEVEFIVQRRATPIFKHFESLIRSQAQDQFRAAICSFLQMVAIRCEKGFSCQNVGLQNHFGFIEGQPIQFDCGILARDLSMKYPLNIQKEILRVAERLDIWARAHCPEAIFLIQEEAQRIINQLF